MALYGTGNSTRVVGEDCSGQTANYKVIQVVSKPSKCVRDVDKLAFDGDPGTNQTWALCLDVNWQDGKCFDLAGTHPQSVACSAANAFKATNVITGSASQNLCVGESTGGFPHASRNFVVCVRGAAK
ncbi:LppU/SCO3897 family protein [Tsukamurella pulmonis]|uniref:LppU/SCO3897 family protein n=1 Tax=Tsukamurella pulmonis TaxID=47312 RepID=UPI003CC823E9